MKRLLVGAIRFEVYCAVGLGALGEFWAGRALARLRKFSGEPFENAGTKE